MKYWLMKTEPSEYSIDTLKKERRSRWEGVRNFQARNFMKEMEIGDKVLFYHGSTEHPGVYGLARVSKRAVPDSTQFKMSSEYYDQRARKDKPLWYAVEVSFVKKFVSPVLLSHLRGDRAFKTMPLLRPGQRLSVQPVEKLHFDLILASGLKKPASKTSHRK